jgi:hypothetical protein
VTATAPFIPADPRTVYDVVVYGGTSSGVIAAVQAARRGGRVALVAPEHHLGGMSSSGLGLTDMGHTDTIGGLALEFYHRVWKHYLAPDAWRDGSRADYLESHPWHWGVTGQEVDRRQAQFMFEPHVAERIFNDLLLESEAHVALSERIDRGRPSAMDGTSIASLRCESGRSFRGRTYIDASYEGDLLAQAGVSYVVGREANADHGETFNGVHPNPPLPFDPFNVAGDPASGTLPGIDPAPPGPAGTGDRRVQAYGFRLCLTDVADNRIDIGPPPNYDPGRYELHARYYQSFGPDAHPGSHRYAYFGLFGDGIDGVTLFSRLPNRKTDSNNCGFASTDLIGGSHRWAHATYAQRDQIWREHQHYTQGLLYFARTDRRLPAAVRETLAAWGPARDEFADQDHWPYELYVREARRMVSDYVITEHDTTGDRVADDGIALGSYPADSHHVSCYVDRDGRPRTDGGFWDTRTRSFPLSYRAIRPRAGECTNLLVSGCISTTHVAYASARMEPVFMMLGQAAATAALLAVGAARDVQDIDVAALRRRLLEDGAVLEPRESATQSLPVGESESRV